MFQLGKRIIGEDSPPFIIAELSANHNGSLTKARETISAAKKSGAHAVKLQTYTPDTMTIDCDAPDFLIQGGLWDGYKLYDLYQEAQTPYEWHAELFQFARSLDIEIFSTPFDDTAIELLMELDAPAYKIASCEVTDLLLIEKAAKTKKPLLMSTGMASEEEVNEAVETAKSSGCDNILLFHCISSYPAPIDQANLRKIELLKKRFNVEVGFSDHTLDNTAAMVAIALGATAVEKHFILDRSEKGPDSDFSIEPHQLKKLVNDSFNIWESLGTRDFSRPQTEKSVRPFRRSIYFVNNLAKGQTIKEHDIKRIRPGHGLPPKYFNELIGKVVNRNVSRGEPVKWDILKSMAER